MFCLHFILSFLLCWIPFLPFNYIFVFVLSFLLQAHSTCVACWIAISICEFPFLYLLSSSFVLQFNNNMDGIAVDFVVVVLAVVVDVVVVVVAVVVNESLLLLLLMLLIN